MSIIKLTKEDGITGRRETVEVDALRVTGVATVENYGGMSNFTRLRMEGAESILVFEPAHEVVALVKRAREASKPAPVKPAMTDAELVALAAMANVEAVLMAGDNASRAMNGYGPMWADGHGFMSAGTALFDELRRRGTMK
jgi:hypothetical protein